MKKLFVALALLSITVLILFRQDDAPSDDLAIKDQDKDTGHSIIGIVHPGESLQSIFDKNNLDHVELAKIYKSSKKVYDLSRISAGDFYTIEVDGENRIQNLKYEVSDLSYLKVSMFKNDFKAEKILLNPEKRVSTISIDIKDNLMYSMPGSHNEYMKLALQLSDIYAWDIDFSSDIRNGDSVKMIVEELWTGNVFQGYGDILAAEFINNGKVFHAYRFEHKGVADYYDRNGKSLRKALLRSPLKFKYISSRFSKRRFHPKLRFYRPHLGVDYAAKQGTPVSAAGNGKVVFAAYKGQNGNLIKIRHYNGYETYYGHLSKFRKGIRRGKKVNQGEIIGYVGSTGLSTGPHLDYRIKLNNKFIDPLKLRLPRGKSIPKNLMVNFRHQTEIIRARFASIKKPVVALKSKDKLSWSEGG